jgi:uncharacterized protein YggE
MSRFASPLLILALSAIPARAQTPSPPTEPPVIVTQGEASVKRAPDQAVVSISAEARAPKSAEAQRKAAEAMTTLQAALKNVGLPADAIKTTNFSLTPDMEYSGGSARVKGYIVSNQIEVRVEAIDKISDVLDAAGSSGATTISGLRFDLKDRPAVEREALRLAVQDAMQRAQAMAAGAGRTLGPILRVEEHRAGTPVPREMMTLAARAPGAQTPITPGETEIRAQVVMTVAIK